MRAVRLKLWDENASQMVGFPATSSARAQPEHA